MRLVYTLLLTVIVAGATAYFVRPTTGASGQETAFQRVIRTNTIRCGYYTWPGMIEKDVTSGKMKGFLAEGMPALGTALGLKIEWTEEVGSDQMMDGLATGRYDVICSPIIELPNRAKSGLMTHPIYYWPTYAYVRANDKRFDSNRASLNHKNVRFAAMDGEFSEVFARQAFPQASVVPVPALAGMAQVYMTMTTNRADVVLSEPFTAEGYMANNPGKIRQIPGEPIYVGPLVFAVGPKEWQLQQFLDVGIRGLLDQGIIARLIKESPEVQKYVVPVAKPYRGN